MQKFSKRSFLTNKIPAKIYNFKPDDLHALIVKKKPSGLWYQIETSWLDWLIGAEWEIPTYLCEIDVDISKILIIDTFEKFEQFHEEYSRYLDEFPFNIEKGIEKLFNFDEYYENLKKDNLWKTLSKQHSGIEILDFKHEINLYERLNLDKLFKYFWYYGWDVASDCIWDSSAVKIIETHKLEDLEDIR